MADKVDWKRAIHVESKVADIMARQERRGVWFDTQRAKWYIHILTERILRIDQVAVPQMPKMVTVGTPINKPFKKNGEPSEILLKWLRENPGHSVGGPFTRISYDDFDFGKVGLFKEWMLKHGWIPDEWNVKNLTLNSLKERLNKEDQARVLNGYIQDLREDVSGPLRIKLLGIKKGTSIGDVKKMLLKRKLVPTTPKITESSLETIQSDLGALVQQRMIWTHRRSLLQGLVESVRKDHRLSARANPCATPTARMRHSVVVNIPAARSPFGKELRGLFQGTPVEGVDPKIHSRFLPSETVQLVLFTNRVQEFKKGSWKKAGVAKKYLKKNRMVFVGYDGAGLELRMLAHYINDPEFTRELIEGDVHARNQAAAGLPTRDDAKTFIYAFLYGAGDGKLGLIIGGSSRDGAAIRAKFLEANPLLAQLIDRVREQAEKGYLIGIDGRKLWMRRNEFGEVMAHKALNTLLQAAGAIVMKYAMVWLDDEVKKANLRAFKVLDMHDEGQWECHPEDVDKLRELMDNCVRRAGEYLGMNCPLASDSIAGSSWYETH